MGIILGGYDQRDGKISYHLGEIHSKDDPTLVRKNRHVKKPSYAAMGYGESFALTVLSNYNANSTPHNGRNVLVDAVYQGILNDCHNDGNVDICTLIPLKSINIRSLLDKVENLTVESRNFPSGTDGNSSFTLYHVFRAFPT
ncbi:hypothetical protein Tco_0364351 [Tanacetum coccineum]